MLELFTPKQVVIPINYQYPLSAVIYDLLSRASAEYSRFLHRDGYLGMDGKRRKMFTFSWLQFTPRADLRRHDGQLEIKANSHATLQIASLFIDDFLLNLIIGLTQNNCIKINQARFDVLNITALPEPKLYKQTRFRTLSPITLSTVRERNGLRECYYYRPLHPELARAVQKSLVGKYETFYQRRVSPRDFKFRIDEAYIAKRGGEDRVSKLVHIKQGTPQESRIKAFECPFILDGPTELKRVAWHCGIGDRTSMGFGCIDI